MHLGSLPHAGALAVRVGGAVFTVLQLKEHCNELILLLVQASTLPASYTMPSNNPPPFKGLNIRIPIIIPIKGKGLINHGCTLRPEL